MTADSPDLDRLDVYARKVEQIGGGFTPASLMPDELLALIAELRQARADLEWTRRTLDLRTKALARVTARTEPSTTDQEDTHP